MWQGNTGVEDRRGVGLTLLVPEGLDGAIVNPVVAPNAVPADREEPSEAPAALVPPVFDPDFVPEPPDVDVRGAGPDFGFLAVQSTGWNPPDPNNRRRPPSTSWSS